MSIAAVLAGTARPLPRITPTAFAKRADAICADYRTKAARLPPTRDSDMAGVYRLALAALAIAKPEVAKLHALPLPATNRAVARAWVARHDRLLVLLGQLRDAARKKEPRAVARSFAALDANATKEHQLASRLGMKVCSIGG